MSLNSRNIAHAKCRSFLLRNHEACTEELNAAIANGLVAFKLCCSGNVCPRSQIGMYDTLFTKQRNVYRTSPPGVSATDVSNVPAPLCGVPTVIAIRTAAPLALSTHG